MRDRNFFMRQKFDYVSVYTMCGHNMNLLKKKYRIMCG